MTWVLHPGGEARYYLRLIQVYNINAAQLRELGLCMTKDDYLNICTHNYQHIAQSIDDLSDPIQQNKLYSSEESTLSFTDDTDMHCDYNISAHNSDIPNIDDTYKSFMPKHPAAHSQ